MKNQKHIFKAGMLLIIAILPVLLLAQIPQKVSYQMVVRDASGQLVKESTVGVQISILQGTTEGSAVYIETHAPQSNVNGLVSLEVGNGTLTGSTFADIDWANGPYFLQVETDPAGGNAYTISGISEILSVPYALHAKTAEIFTGTLNETDPSVPVGTTPGEMQYWDGSAWVTVAPGDTGQRLRMVNGVPVWLGETLENVVANPVTGKIWMDRNLGASRLATSCTDAEAYGDLYQWGRGTDGHEKRDSPTTTTLSTSDTPGHGSFILAYDWRNPQNTDLWQGVDGTNNPCPSGYRLPTSAELDAERQSWSSNDAAGAFASPLKLPVAGSRDYSNGSLSGVGSSGVYWSSTVDGTDASYLYFSSSDADIYSDGRAFGFSVRCLKD